MDPGRQQNDADPQHWGKVKTTLIFIFLVVEADMQQLPLDITRTSVI